MKNILMNTEMTKAILDGRKAQTRRVVKLPDCKWSNGKKTKVSISKIWYQDVFFNGTKEKTITITGIGDDEDYTENQFTENFAKYQIDDILWVREPARVNNFAYINKDTNKVDIQCFYTSDNTKIEIPLPDRFYDEFGKIPEWANNCQGIPNGCIKEMARIFLRITNVRVERLQDISYEECIKEGVFEYETVLESPKFQYKYSEKSMHYSTPKLAFMALWNSTAPKGYKWEDNPYVFVYEFDKVVL